MQVVTNEKLYWIKIKNTRHEIGPGYCQFVISIKSFNSAK